MFRVVLDDSSKTCFPINGRNAIESDISKKIILLLFFAINK